MISARSCLVFFALSLAAGAELPLSTPAPAFPGATPSDAELMVVVYNNADAASLELAGYYADKRHIPFDRLIGLDCPAAEEITREEFDRTIAEPLRKVFTERNWWRVSSGENPTVTQNQMRYLTLMRGIPLKISQTASYPGDTFSGQPALNKNEACVDSELALLGAFSRKISGPAPNPYFRSFTPFADAHLAPMMLVCRIDAPTNQIAHRMIDDALAAEAHGLWGFAYIDRRGIADGPLSEGDKWLANIAAQARTNGVPVIEDEAPADFDADFPMQNAALYFGWYNDSVDGPFSRETFRFNRGGVACHIHSFSGVTLRDPHQHWVAPLLARGAAAVLGNVYEPYLALTPNLDIFYDHLRNGFNFAESAYASLRGLSWMNTTVGDPLYRPFKMRDDQPAAAPDAQDWIEYQTGARLWFTQNRAAGEKSLQQSARKLRSGIILEGLGLLQRDSAHDSTAALGSFAQAQGCYTNANDVLRTVFEQVETLRVMKRTKEAVTMIGKATKRFPTEPAANLLRKLEKEMTAPPAASPVASPTAS
ncbi:MAG: hypothetical protein QOD99_1696 [Chthoniobacter sp.]|nr:hypothetical protein [Chthoniobacter sp.]